MKRLAILTGMSGRDDFFCKSCASGGRQLYVPVFADLRRPLFAEDADYTSLARGSAGSC